MIDELESLNKTINHTNKILMSFTEQLAKLTIKIEAIEDKLNYRKQAQEERFIPPENSQNRGED